MRIATTWRVRVPLLRPLLSILALVAPGVATAQSLPPRDSGTFCFRGRPLPDCNDFLLLEVGASGLVLTNHRFPDSAVPADGGHSSSIGQMSEDSYAYGATSHVGLVLGDILTATAGFDFVQGSRNQLTLTAGGRLGSWASVSAAALGALFLVAFITTGGPR